MKTIADKWYIGLVILPVLTNILTGYLDLPTLLKNWNLTIVGTLMIIIFIIVYEYYLLRNENRILSSTPKNSDKKNVLKLLEILDINTFQDKICNQSCWYGYDKKAMYKTIKFCEKATLLKYRTADEKLNDLIQDLRNSILEFEQQCTKILYSNGDFLSPDKNTDINVQRTKEIFPIADQKSAMAFSKLEVLLAYLKERNYLE